MKPELYRPLLDELHADIGEQEPRQAELERVREFAVETLERETTGKDKRSAITPEHLRMCIQDLDDEIADVERQLREWSKMVDFITRELGGEVKLEASPGKNDTPKKTGSAPAAKKGDVNKLAQATLHFDSSGYPILPPLAGDSSSKVQSS